MPCATLSDRPGPHGEDTLNRDGEKMGACQRVGVIFCPPSVPRLCSADNRSYHRPRNQRDFATPTQWQKIYCLTFMAVLIVYWVLALKLELEAFIVIHSNLKARAPKPLRLTSVISRH
ncbi:hypothetical protein DL93DRAFT_1798751 [Clavulina sp. PMI_390]|nr:hypothetical protein DL93DRAFT_1798751 [Clavulina sp. PMI_390]